jgi:hypothetical protein
MKYRICEYCGANLDYGEKCDCQEEKVKRKAEGREMEKKKQKERCA